MAMETALLNCSVDEVIQLLKSLLKKQGYEIEKIDLQETIVLAYRNGKWFTQKQQVIFQISSLEPCFTRIDVTAKIEGRFGNKEAEEVLEEKLVSSIYHFMQ
jgi:DNA replication protein DnaD